MRAFRLFIGPPAGLLFLLFDIGLTVHGSSIDAGTVLGVFIPGPGTGQIARPEGPGSALVGPDGIDRALSLTPHPLQENAVFGERVLVDGGASAFGAQVFLMDLFDAELQELSQKLDFRFGDPDHPLSGS